jgi:hypothetical protein
VFPGSGILFWWQAGAVSALATRFDLRQLHFAGNSGGSLASTMAACSCDGPRALEIALRLVDESGALKRGPFALCGIWGGMVRTWLDEVLPEDAAERCSARAHLLVHRPFDRPERVSDFSSRADLIDACMASLHIPIVMDGWPAARFRGAADIDSDVLALGGTSRTLALPDAAAPSVRIGPRRDTRVREAYPRTSDLLRLNSAEQVRQLMAWGEDHVARMESAGELRPLDAARLSRESTGDALPEFARASFFRTGPQIARKRRRTKSVLKLLSKTKLARHASTPSPHFPPRSRPRRGCASLRARISARGR